MRPSTKNNRIKCVGGLQKPLIESARLGGLNLDIELVSNRR